MHVVVLSGPRDTEQRARTALAEAGFSVSPSQGSHGMRWPADTAFVTVHGAEVELASRAVADFGYVPRMCEAIVGTAVPTVIYPTS